MLPATNVKPFTTSRPTWNYNCSTIAFSPFPNPYYLMHLSRDKKGWKDFPDMTFKILHGLDLCRYQ